MTGDISKQMRRSRKSDKTSATKQSPVRGSRGPLAVEAVRSGEWLLGDELRNSLLAASRKNRHLSIDLGGIDHLDANSLQLLLALSLDQQRAGGTLRLLNPSPSLLQWFTYAGASKLLPETEMEA